MGNTIYSGPMGNKELKRLADDLQHKEWELENEWALRHINGGFVRVDMTGFNNDYIYVDIMSGVQCGCDNDYSHTEQAKLDRKTLEWAD